jgi:hypothetical protein
MSGWGETFFEVHPCHLRCLLCVIAGKPANCCAAFLAYLHPVRVKTVGNKNGQEGAFSGPVGPNIIVLPTAARGGSSLSFALSPLLLLAGQQTGLLVFRLTAELPSSAALALHSSWPCTTRSQHPSLARWTGPIAIDQAPKKGL